MLMKPLLPPLPPSNIHDSSLSQLCDYLYKTPFGQEDEKVLQHFVQHPSLHEQSSWHALFRLWLLGTLSQQDNVLPLILSKLQASLLHNSSFLLWDTTEDATWKEDVFVQDWSVTKCLVKLQLQCKTLCRQEQVDVNRILKGIDQLVGYTNYDVKTSPTSDVGVVGDVWNDKHCRDNDNDTPLNIEEWLQKVEQGPQWRVRRTVREIPKSHQLSLLQTSCYSTKTNKYRRGRALLASFLTANNHERESTFLAPVPSSSDDEISKVVRDYLDINMIPNVHQLALTLWEYHLNKKTILDILHDFGSWLPIEPIATRYRALWKDSGADSMVQIVGGTNFLCTLIGNQVEEWNEIWNDDLMKSVMLPLIHATMLNPCDKSVSARFQVLGDVINRILETCPAQATVDTCPALTWLISLMNNVSMSINDNENPVNELYARLLGNGAKTPLPPVSLYIQSALTASLLSTLKESQDAWMQHVVRILVAYKQNDKLVKEWFRCLKEQKVMSLLTKSLHRRVCCFLWEPSNAKTLISLPQLLVDTKDARILSWTPPKCLFGDTGSLVSSLGQLLSAYGDTRQGLGVIAVGLILALSNDSSNVEKCRDLLYQYLQEPAAEGDIEFFEQIERELVQHPASKDWWKKLSADLVRNEVPMFMVNEEPTEYDFSLIDNLLIESHKRPREEEPLLDMNDGASPHLEGDADRPATAKARTRKSAAAVIQNLYGDSTQTHDDSETLQVGDKTAGKVEPTVTTRNEDSGGDDDSYSDDGDDEILFL